jgi:hypothetical protein
MSFWLFLFFLPILTATYDYTVKRLNITYRYTFGNLLYTITKLCRKFWEKLGILFAYVSSFLSKLKDILRKVFNKVVEILEKFGRHFKDIFLGVCGELKIQLSYDWEITLSWLCFFKSYFDWARANAGVKTVITGSAILIGLLCFGLYSGLVWYGWLGESLDKSNETVVVLSRATVHNVSNVTNGSVSV